MNYQKFLLYILMGICVACTISAAVCFWIEVDMHPDSFHIVPAILASLMLIVPYITQRGRRGKEGNNLCDIIFVLYGAVTHFLCCFSVGFAGDRPWGCSIKGELFSCDMNHPGVWGSFFFAIASITGHAFGWERIKVQRKGNNQFKVSNEFRQMVIYSVFISLYTIAASIVMFIVHLSVNHRWPLGILYFVVAVFNIIKLMNLADDVDLIPSLNIEDWDMEYSTQNKWLINSVINIALIVWVTGATWYILGSHVDAEKDLGVPILSVVVSTSIAVLQHFHI